MLRRVKRIPAAVLVLLALGGCAQEVPYRTEETVARAIPRERARTVLAELLAKGSTWRGGKYEVVEVADVSFAYRLAGGEEEFRREYPALAPRLFRHPSSERVEVVLVAFEQKWRLRETDSVWFDASTDAEMFVDAIECLKRETRP